MKNKLLLLVAMAITAMLLLSACGSNDASENNEGSGARINKFSVGLEAGYPPFNWTQMDDSNGGCQN